VGQPYNTSPNKRFGLNRNNLRMERTVPKDYFSLSAGSESAGSEAPSVIALRVDDVAVTVGIREAPSGMVLPPLDTCCSASTVGLISALHSSRYFKYAVTSGLFEVLSDIVLKSCKLNQVN
jgi:energy-converting hydrogenase Eha subunit C